MNSSEREALCRKLAERIYNLDSRVYTHVGSSLGRTLISPREKSVEILDSDAVFRWLRQTGHPECYRIRKPEINKERVGALLEKGEKIPGAELVVETVYSVE